LGLLFPDLGPCWRICKVLLRLNPFAKIFLRVVPVFIDMSCVVMFCLWLGLKAARFEVALASLNNPISCSTVFIWLIIESLRSSQQRHLMADVWLHPPRIMPSGSKDHLPPIFGGLVVVLLRRKSLRGLVRRQLHPASVIPFHFMLSRRTSAASSAVRCGHTLLSFWSLPRGHSPIQTVTIVG
jgi:hypothetical protein